MGNECLEDALAELRAVGISPEVSHGGKHIRIHWTYNGAPRSHTIPKTSSDWRSPMNNRSQLRTTLKRDGLIGSDDKTVVELPRVTVRDGSASVSSLDIARHFEKAHKDVLRAIDKAILETGPEFAERNFAPSGYIDQTGRTLRAFDLSRDAFSFLVMGFTGAGAVRWKLAYIDAFNKMEAEFRKAAETISLPADITTRIARVEADLRALVDLSLSREAEPGFIYVKAHKRRARAA